MLQYVGLKRLAKEVAHQAVAVLAHRKCFHPVKQYLNGLEWDGEPRIEQLFTRYFGAETTPYTEAIGRMFMIGMVARIFEPGCKHDYMPVVEGPQGQFKSAAARILGAPWFDDDLPEIGSGKEVKLHLRGKWLLEIAEMHAMSRAEITLLNSFITRTHENYRRPYGTLEVHEPRQCVFFGTTNKDSYLKDETGGRRFWPVLATGVIALEALKNDRNQLFAEAVVRYREGAHWWPDRDFEQRYIAPEQGARYVDDAWEEVLAEHVRGRDRTTMTDAALALGILTPRLSVSDQGRITRAFARIGWCRGSRGGPKGRRQWVPKPGR
jgi:predicted P-loop ATPase